MDIVLRGLVLYVFIVFVMRVIGRRELSWMTPFDLVLLIILGDAIQQGLTQDDYSVTGAILAVERGRLVEHNLVRERMTADEVAEEMRQQQISSLDQVEWGILEANGSISFIEKSS